MPGLLQTLHSACALRLWTMAMQRFGASLPCPGLRLRLSAKTLRRRGWQTEGQPTEGCSRTRPSRFAVMRNGFKPTVLARLRAATVDLVGRFGGLCVVASAASHCGSGVCWTP
jgi:hypothetical protein